MNPAIAIVPVILFKNGLYCFFQLLIEIRRLQAFDVIMIGGFRDADNLQDVLQSEFFFELE